MKAVVQRVARAAVRVGGEARGAIGAGLLVYLGVGIEDDESDARWMAEKIAALRIFDDGAGKMNLCAEEAGAASLLVVSQFTIMGDARKGRRPSWSGAAGESLARELYERFIELARALGLACETGEFRARMAVESVNDGPVTILLDSKGAA
ncbi:MAG: D-aminoacyl-tRNA deacylase [Treponema sp.]|nr:D-aminoacyl-tRNA deacylase [Treponema sp.]